MSVRSLPLPVKSARPTAERDSSAPPFPTSDGGSSVGVLLKIEGELRKIRSLPELDCLVANETRLVTRSQQTFVFLRMHAATPELTAVSAMAAIDRSAPLMVGSRRSFSNSGPSMVCRQAGSSAPVASLSPVGSITLTIPCSSCFGLLFWISMVS